MLRRWLGLDSKTGEGDIGWSIALSPVGERLVVLDGAFKAPIFSVGSDGRISISDASSPRGRSFRLVEGAADTLISSAQSVIVGTVDVSGPAFAMAPVLKKGQKPEISYARGKIHSITVERVVDDGVETGVWRGFVTAEGRPGEIFLELLPSLPLKAGTAVRIVGVIDDAGMGVETGRKVRFRRGAWIPVDERLGMFARELSVQVGSSSNDEDQGETRSAMAVCLSAAAALRHGRSRTKEPMPFTCTPLGLDETPAQKSFRRRMMAANEGSRTTNLFSQGRRMAMPATDWHGAVQDNGDLIIEIRREAFAVRPAAVTVILSRTTVSTLDGLPSRIGVRCTFPDGSSVSMLLGGGPQHLAKEIAKRRNVVVVQGEPGAKNYAQISMSVAGVERR